MTPADMLPRGMNPAQYAEFLRKLAGHYANLAHPLMFHLYQAAGLIEYLYGAPVKRQLRPDLRERFEACAANARDIEELLNGPPGTVHHSGMKPLPIGMLGVPIAEPEPVVAAPPGAKKARIKPKEAPTGGFFG